jgi:hypothetical protein
MGKMGEPHSRLDIVLKRENHKIFNQSFDLTVQMALAAKLEGPT